MLFPLAITGIAQLLFPNQANGDLVTVNGCVIGSSMIAQNFNASVFFYPRPAGQSASGVDPDITLQNATAQIPRISEATGISNASLESLLSARVEGTFWVFGSPYVDVLRLNVALINAYPQTYDRYLPPSVANGTCASP